MSIDETVNKQITKAEFDKLYKDSLMLLEEQMHEKLTELNKFQEAYINLLNFRQKYRTDYKLFRIKHMFNYDTGHLTYIPQEKRQIGYKYKKK